MSVTERSSVSTVAAPISPLSESNAPMTGAGEYGAPRSGARRLPRPSGTTSQRMSGRRAQRCSPRRQTHPRHRVSNSETIVYHFIRKIDNGGRLWGQPEHLCLNGNALEVDDSSESDIVYMKSVANQDTPEYVCEHTNCLAAVEFMCSEFQGKCDEPVSRLINGHSKAGISNAKCIINCTTSYNDERLVDKVKVYFMTGMTIVEKNQFETDQNWRDA